MPIFVGPSSEPGYTNWLARHEHDGFVLNAYSPLKPPSPGKWRMCLHKASCRTISSTGEGASTEGKYQKVCSTDVEEIVEWLENQRLGFNGITKTCGACHPQIGGAAQAREPMTRAARDEHFERQVQAAMNLPPDERRRRLEAAPEIPTRSTVTILVFDRNQYVVAEVRNRADGKCERCGEMAPFKRRSDRTPYLEVHPTVPLADGGPDTVENAEALCPNCHREAHHG